jgi:ubiquinone/menaquinone biosynthesis C-methylase UbiE
MDSSNIDPVVWFIHEHRYRWAREFAKGRVLDIACGVGYGSAILRQNERVTKYVGMDCSEEALAEARTVYAADGVLFAKGDANALPFPDGAFDTVVSLETIEHLSQPEAAVKEFARILSPIGCLVGSVPTRAYEELASAIHGENPYHLTVFDFEDIQALLGRYFKQIRFYAATVDVVTRFRNLETVPSKGDINQSSSVTDDGPICGSYIFVASKRDLEIDSPDKLMYGLNILRYDQIRLDKLYDILKNKDASLEEKDQYIAVLEEKIGEIKGLFFKPHLLFGKIIKKLKARLVL